MKKHIKLAALSLGLLALSCSPEDMIDDNIADATKTSVTNTVYAKTSSPVLKTWDFTNLDQWTDASQNGPGYYQISENGTLNIYTHANTWERSKIKTISTFADGTYSWNVFVPEMGVGDMASIGAFLYSDDTHELDFEIGYGSQTVRNQLAAETDDLIVYMSSQGNPSLSAKTKIKRNQWYNLQMELKLNSKSRYMVSWKINEMIIASAQLSYGNRSKFNIFCSVENLQFMGDHIPIQDNYALFDSVTFKGI